MAKVGLLQAHEKDPQNTQLMDEVYVGVIRAMRTPSECSMARYCL